MLNKLGEEIVARDTIEVETTIVCGDNYGIYAGIYNELDDAYAVLAKNRPLNLITGAYRCNVSDKS